MEHVNPHHAAVVRNSTASRHVQTALSIGLDLVDHRPRCAIPLRLMEGLGKGLFSVSSELLQPRL